MRTFYIFKINKEMTILMRETPYNLYHAIEQLYYLDTVNSNISMSIYRNIFSYFDKEYVDKRIMYLFKQNRFYSFQDGKHSIINKYRPENTYLKVYRSHIILKTDAINPTLLINYLMSDNLFVCDFKNKDYFWLNEFVH